MRKITIAVLIAVLASTARAVPARAQDPVPAPWVDAHCSRTAVRERYQSFAGDDAGAELSRAERVRRLFTVMSMERECRAAAAESAKPEPLLVADRPWTVFCSGAQIRARHPSADNGVQFDLQTECYAALQAAADAKQELRRCWYRSVSECNTGGCTDRRSAPAPDERWLEIPILSGNLFTTTGPWRTVRRCDVRGCDRIEVEVDWSGSYFTFKQREGAWFVKVLGSDEPPFIEVATLGLDALVYYGNCPGS